MLAEPPAASDVGYVTADDCLVTSHFGDHPHLDGATMSIPYEWNDPDDRLRVEAKGVLDRFVRPRPVAPGASRPVRFAHTSTAITSSVSTHEGPTPISEQEQRAHRVGARWSWVAM